MGVPKLLGSRCARRLARGSGRDCASMLLVSMGFDSSISPIFYLLFERKDETDG